MLYQRRIFNILIFILVMITIMLFSVFILTIYGSLKNVDQASLIDRVLIKEKQKAILIERLRNSDRIQKIEKKITDLEKILKEVRERPQGDIRP